MTQTIETPRLRIRRFQESDAADLHAYLSNPEVYRFEPGEPISLELARRLAVDRAKGQAYWAVVLKSNAKQIGHLYFLETDPREFRTWQLGYIFNPAYQNQGYASEAARALIEYGFAHWGIHRVVAHCDPENVASWRVMEKIGMTREGRLRKNACFRKDENGRPLWCDSYEYAILEEDLAKPRGGDA